MLIVLKQPLPSHQQDGVCNLCNRSVQFVAAQDPPGRVHFCALQSRAALPLLAANGLTRADVSARFAYLEKSSLHLGSTAVSFWHLCGPTHPPRRV